MFSQGLAIFTLGVTKKVLIADTIAQYATPVFTASANGVLIPFLEAWGGALAYTFQIYFDFSAYSDMAIGLGLMFGLRLPLNFNSPYKAASLIDFWRRWHISLTRFLKDYLYIPLGGNRQGARRRYANVMAVMLLGGLWHGANWTFVVWGGLHGLGLVANHAFRKLWGGAASGTEPGVISLWSGRILTFLFVVTTWVFFRADNFSSATNILNGMIGANGVVLPLTYLERLGSLGDILEQAGIRFEVGYLFLGVTETLWLLVLFVVVVALPNTTQWARYSLMPNEGTEPRSAPWLAVLGWRPSLSWGVALSLIMMVSLIMMSDAGEFLYFQF
jgi:D-alanyl-lipoteichoic acid acyltransferase DltB (MBOAT superfamily)